MACKLPTVQRFLSTLLLVLSLGGCVHRDEALVLVGGVAVPAARIDAAPLGLLPSGALAIGRLDGRALFASALGGTTADIVARVLPLGRESNFSAARDVHRVFGAIYAMQGADFCAVLQGNFDVQTIAQAAARRAATPSGTPLVRTPYAGYSIYTVANIGFAVLTPHTILSGDETGMRRALDRLRSGRLEHELEPWMGTTLGDAKAAFAVVASLDKEGVIQAVAERVPFVLGATRVRLLGNFASPGINAVGTVDNADVDAASRGAAGFAQLRELAAFASFFAAFGGAQAPKLEVEARERQLSFAASVDTAFMQFLLGTLGQALRPATSSWVGR